MKLHKILFLSLTALVLSLTGCDKPFDELEKNPNLATQATASLVLQGVLLDMYGVTGQPWGDEQRWNQFYCSNYDYYASNQYNWTTTGLNFTTLKNVVKMEEEAKRAGASAVNPYSALGKFFRAYFFDNMTRRVGDVPMMEALKGLENPTPTYDSQKAVYVQILKWLDEANANLTTLIAAGNTTMTGDFYLGNNLRQWQKVVNAHKLRVLVSLSQKDADRSDGPSELNVKARFAEVVGNPTKFPLMAGLSDNVQYIHTAVNKYRRSQDNFGNNATRENMAKTYIDLLVARKDPRVFVVAEPAGAKLATGLKPTDVNSFAGASSGEDLADIATKVLSGQYSYQNRKRYYTNYVGELVAIIGYIEQQFNIAEGINRGWAVGNAEIAYNQGVTASMGFYGLKDGDNTVTFSRDGGIVNFDSYTVKVSLSDYLAQPLVKYAGNTAAGREQIVIQKYLGFFQNSGMEAFYNQRRTGIPAFLTGVGTGNSARIPKRWLYPNGERVNNTTNLTTALTAQYGGKDDINDTPWLLK